MGPPSDINGAIDARDNLTPYRSPIRPSSFCLVPYNEHSLRFYLWSTRWVIMLEDPSHAAVSQLSSCNDIGMCLGGETWNPYKALTAKVRLAATVMIALIVLLNPLH